MPDDLTPEEREECLQEYLDIFKNSSGNMTAEVRLRINLDKLGLDRDEIDYLVRTNRP
jgi:hypothetical protein